MWSTRVKGIESTGASGDRDLARRSEASFHESLEGERVTEHERDMRDIRLSLNGDGDAYARIMEDRQEAVSRRMWRFTRDEIEHRELVQEVFVQAFLSLASYRGGAPLDHWLARIATTVGYKYWKRRSRDRARISTPIEDLKDELASSPPEDLAPEQAASILHRLLEELPPRDRLVLMLRYVEDRSVEETAALTGWSVSMVKVQAWRARNKLRKLLEKAGVEVDL